MKECLPQWYISGPGISYYICNHNPWLDLSNFAALYSALGRKLPTLLFFRILYYRPPISIALFLEIIHSNIYFIILNIQINIKSLNLPSYLFYLTWDLILCITRYFMTFSKGKTYIKVN